MQTKEETFLANYSLPNSEVTEELAALAATRCARCHDWGVAARVFTYRRVEWAINSFAPYKNPGIDGIFPTLFQEGWKVVVPYLAWIFHACLSTGYVPAIWHQVKVVFIRKCSRNSYSGPSDFRPISLISFLLKTMARLVDGYLQDEVLVLVTLHPDQHGYQAGK
jgi:hypothetical protein